jgi:hypothetical protein
LASIFALAFGIYGISQRNNANNTLKKLENEQYTKYLNLAEEFYEQESYSEAIVNYKDALRFKNEKKLKEKIKKCENILKQKDEFDAHFNKGIGLYLNGDFIGGILELKKAEKLNYKSKFIRQTIKDYAGKAIRDCKKAAQKMGEIRLFNEQRFYKAKADTLERISKEYF